MHALKNIVSKMKDINLDKTVDKKNSQNYIKKTL